MLTGEEFGSVRRQAGPICLYERRLRLSSLAPSKTPPTANAAGRPRPIRGAGALQCAQAIGTAFCANAGTVLRHSQVISAKPFIAKLRLSQYLTPTASCNYKNVSQINRDSQASFTVNSCFFENFLHPTTPGELTAKAGEPTGWGMEGRAQVIT